MPASTKPAKTECRNPNTGSMNIDAATYELFAKAITHTLQGDKQLTYTQLVAGVKDFLQQQQVNFGGSVEWYSVTVKNALQSEASLKYLPGRAESCTT
jgi:hypothetical protein